MTNQTAIETKEFQQVEPTAEQIAIHKADRCEERMKVATISEQTRRIIVLMGKVMDMYGEVSDALLPICGESQLDRKTEPINNLLNKVNDELEKLLLWSISENMGQIGCKEV